MKQTLTLILVIFCLALSAQTEIPKKAYKIIIKNSLSAEENFNLAGKTLIDNDYIIENKDKDFGTIKTGKKEIFKSRVGSFVINISVKENSISLTGQWSADIELNFGGAKSTNELYKLEYKGLPGDTRLAAFKKMNEFALKLGTDIQYITN